MKHIFNSLGSNYSLAFSLKALRYLFVAPPRQEVITALNTAIKKFFPEFENGPYYFYKGRDAIEFALKTHSIGMSHAVMTQGFTCHAIEAAIRRAGALPAFVDLEKGTLHPSVKTLEAAYEKYPACKAVIIQHTLGFPAPISEIRKWCNRKKILLIEDLAQAFGGVDEDGNLLGSTADVVILSFGRDKIIDAVSGGVCLIKKSTAHTYTENFRSATYKTFFTDLLYPFLTYCIRKLYPIYIGKILLYLSKTFGLIVSPVKSRFEFMTALPVSAGALAVSYFESISEQLAHRRSIAQIYSRELSRYSLLTETAIEHGSCLRFPLTVENPNKLLQYLGTQKINISDRWYRSVVDSGKLAYASKYKTGSCPNAEELSKRVVNLPTHMFITREDAHYICERIQTFLK